MRCPKTKQCPKKSPTDIRDDGRPFCKRCEGKHKDKKPVKKITVVDEVEETKKSVLRTIRDMFPKRWKKYGKYIMEFFGVKHL